MPDMPHPYQPSEKPVATVEEKCIFEHINLPNGTNLYTATQLAAEVERAVAAEQTRIVALVQAFPHWLGPQAKWDLVSAIRKGADDATGT